MGAGLRIIVDRKGQIWQQLAGPRGSITLHFLAPVTMAILSDKPSGLRLPPSLGDSKGRAQRRSNIRKR